MENFKNLRSGPRSESLWHISTPFTFMEKQPSSDPETPQARARTREQSSGKDVELVSPELRSDYRVFKRPSLQVTWDGPKDPANPKNWSKTKRWGITILNSVFMSISPISSSMVAPALARVQSDFAIQSLFETQMILSVFILASAVGPLIVSPLSEVYGRRPVLHTTCAVYLIFNLACGFSRSSAQLLAFRFLSGIGGSAPAIGGGILADCWRAEERGKSLSIYYILPLIGTAVGPIVGGFVVQHHNWRWMFHATSIFSATIQAIGLQAFPETYGPIILRNKAARLRTASGNSNLRTEYEQQHEGVVFVLKQAFIRPCKLLSTQPIIQVLAIYMACVYGLMYLALSTFPSVWVDIYGERPDIASLNYVSLAIGFSLGTQICAPINDYIYTRLKARNDNVGQPEYRVPLMIPGALLVPIGVFWYGWSIHAHAHWVLPNLGATIFGSGIIIIMQCITSYLIDAYSVYAASAIAATTVLRGLAGFAFPLFAPYMYDELGHGWADSVLAFVSMAVGFPAPGLLWKYGAWLRAKSPYAR